MIATRRQWLGGAAALAGLAALPLGGCAARVGEGTIDFADIFTLNDLAGVQHFYVENDQSPAPYLPDIQTSFAALSRLA